MGALTLLRRLMHGSDRARAIVEERQAIQMAVKDGADAEERLLGLLGEGEANSFAIGTAVASGRPVKLTAERLVTSCGVWGPSGSGKTYLAALMLKGLLERGVQRLSLWDPKAETAALCLRILVHVLKRLPEREATELRERIVLFNPFSTTLLPRLQVLKGEPGIEPSLCAYEIANLVTAELDMVAGFRQEAILVPLIECLIRSELPLSALPRVAHEPQILEALSGQHGPTDLFRSTAERLKGERDRVLGIVARVERLLRLSSTRLALSAPDCVDFAKLLDERIVIANIEPPLGAADLGKAVCGLIWMKLQHAIRRRPVGAPKTLLVLEELPAFLGATSNRGASAVEDTYRLARAKSCHIWALSQDVDASLGSIASTLPRVIKENVNLHCIFRTATDDWRFALPVTLRRPKAAPLPWEDRRRASGYLDRGAELSLLTEELARLENRAFYVLDRRTGAPGLLVKSADLCLDATDAEVAELSAPTLTGRPFAGHTFPK